MNNRQCDLARYYLQAELCFWVPTLIGPLSRLTHFHNLARLAHLEELLADRVSVNLGRVGNLLRAQQRLGPEQHIGNGLPRVRLAHLRGFAEHGPSAGLAIELTAFSTD